MPAFIETFESLAEWEIDPDGLPSEAVISRIHATDGLTSLRILYDQPYVPNPAAFALQRLDPVDGDDSATVYWLRYAFLIEEWAGPWNAGNPNAIYLPNFNVDADPFEIWGYGPTIYATSVSAGEFSNWTGAVTQPLTAGVWHTYRVSILADGVDVTYSEWIDGVLVDADTFADAMVPPRGVLIANELGNVRGTVWVDDLAWSPGADPGDAADVETAVPSSTSQWVKLREHPAAGGANAGISVYPTTSEPEAWTYVEIYVPQLLLDELEHNGSTAYFLSMNGNDLLFRIDRILSDDNWHLNVNETDLGSIFGDQWHRFEAYNLEGADTYGVRVNGVVSTVDPGLGPTVPEFTAWEVRIPWYWTGSRDGMWIGVDNLAYSVEGPVGNNFDPVVLWTFEGDLPLINDPLANPELFAAFGVDDQEVTIVEGGAPGPGPGLPSVFPPPGGGGGGGGGGDPGGGGFPAGGFSGRRFFQSFPWRAIVADGNIDEDGEPGFDMETITLLDRLASNRRMLVALKKPRQFDCDVPSGSPEVNITHDDPYEEAFVAEGNRLLYAFRREGGDPPWVIRGSFLIMKIQDNADEEEGTTHITAYDPRQLLYHRKAMNPITGLDIGRMGYTYVGDEAGEIAHDVLLQADFTQGSSRIINVIENVDTSEVIEKFHITQGMSVGEVWDELEATAKLDIVLEPIYDPIQAPGFLVEAFYSAETGSENPGAIFAWDKPSRSLSAVSHEQDGTQRANAIRFGISQGGKIVEPDVPEDEDSILQYGQYWRQQWFPVQKKPAAVIALLEGTLETYSRGRRTVQISPAAERAPVPLRDYDLGDSVSVVWSRNLRQDLLIPSRIVEIPILIDDNALETVQSAVVEPIEFILGT